MLRSGVLSLIYSIKRTPLPQVFDRFTVNGKEPDSPGRPEPMIAVHGSHFYDKTLFDNPWPHWESGITEDTYEVIFLAGSSDGQLVVRPKNCAEGGCDITPAAQSDARDGLLYWSNEATWTGAAASRAKPVAVRDLLVESVHTPPSLHTNSTSGATAPALQQ